MAIIRNVKNGLETILLPKTFIAGQSGFFGNQRWWKSGAVQRLEQDITVFILSNYLKILLCLY